jgi:hypothetical protein
MEWTMLLVAAVLAAAIVATVHAARGHPRLASIGPGLDRRVAQDRAVRAVEADVEAAREAAENLVVTQHPRA